MNLFTISLFLVAILAVRGQDPTAVCYPPIFQTAYYNMLSEDTGVISVDFAKQKFSEVSTVTGNRYVHDFANLKSYAITGEGNFTKCKTFKLQQSQVMYRCLPPYAKIITGVTGYLHYITAERMYIQTWDVDTESDTINRVVFSYVSGQPYWPIMSQEYGYHGTKSFYIYINPAPSVSNLSVFTIPPDCTINEVKISPIVG